MSASIIASLSISGSRKSDGSPNSSGRCWAYLPGTTTPATLYADPDATIVITQPLVLDVGGRVSPSDAPDGVFAAIPIRLYIEDSSTPANVVSDNLFTPATATNTTLDNDGWTGPTEDDAWTVLAEGLGGVDGKYKESGGATERTIKAKFAEAGISVRDYGAAGDGVTIDTTAVQNAFARAKTLSCNVIFPAGTYKVDQAIALTSATGVVIEGRGGATLTTTHASANVITMANCSYCGVRGLTVTSTGTSGTGISATANDHLTVDSVVIANCQTGLSVTGSLINVRGCYIDAFGGGAAQRGIVSTATDVSISGGRITASAGAAIEFASTAARTSVHGVSTGAGGATATGILFNSNLSGAIFSISGCSGLGGCTTPINVTGVTVWPSIRQWGNGVRGPTALSFATGTAQTPNVMVGDEIILFASSGGAGAVTVNLPTVVPIGADADNRYYDFVFVNGAGGAVTWNLNAAYVLNAAAAVPATDAHTIQLRFRYDLATSKFRECSRGDTLT